MIFLQAAIAVMLGVAEDAAPPPTALLGRDLEKNDRRQDYLRARLTRDSDGALLAEAFSAQDSSMISLLAHADGLIVRAPHAPAAPAGKRVDVLTFPKGYLAT